MKQIRIPLSFATLVVERGSDPHYGNEVFIGLYDHNGVWFQDLAVVGERYHIENGKVVLDGDISLRVYADESQEDYTHNFTIGVYQEPD